MDRFAGFIMSALLLSACSGESLEPGAVPGGSVGDVLSHGMIVLGDKLENPYTTENVRDAYVSVYPTKSREEIQTSHLYVRFLPENSAKFDLLNGSELELLDYPLDYQILVDGDYYHDPSLPEESITWQYAVVPKDYEFPDIRYEILDECHITESDLGTRSSDGIDWEAVEREAYRLTGNEEYLMPESKKPKVNPSGRITIVDEYANGGQAFGVAGVKVVCNTFVKFSSAYTDRDGYYSIPKKFSAKLRYRLMFKNEKGFAIGFNWVLVPASVSTLGRASADGISTTITKSSDRKLYLRSVVNNAAYDYITRCAAEDMDLTLPPEDLRIWLFSGLSASSAVMIHHKTVVKHEYISKFLGPFAGLIAFFAPDVTIGTKEMTDYRDVYRAVTHELAHCSHFSQVGTGYWDKYIEYILRSYISTGGMTYGDGTEQYAGYCEVGEMWAYYMESMMYKERYGGAVPQFGTSYWFSPQIFRYLDDRGFSKSDFLAAMQPDVTDIPSLQSRMCTLYPSKRTMIEQVFYRYR